MCLGGMLRTRRARHQPSFISGQILRGSHREGGDRGRSPRAQKQRGAAVRPRLSLTSPVLDQPRARPVKAQAAGSTSAARQSFSASPRRKFVIPHCITQAMPFSAAKRYAIQGSPKA